ncbi:MAG: sensor domain-containing diguanylate cyclase [Thiotrichales bacterium]|jgi:diguanylate cyclase (GGDEF)-like protein|nr:sensor domain-containing diguanylate cyclase [Thiotrichales bacterium]
MIDWQRYLPLIESILADSYPALENASQSTQDHLQRQPLRSTHLLQLFSQLTADNEDEQIALFVHACITNEIPYTLIYTDLMTLGRTLLGQLVYQQACDDMLALHKFFERIEQQISLAYLHNYLRQLAVRNHLRLTHLANLSEKNLMVYYQNHLQWMIRLIDILQGNEVAEGLEFDHLRCSFGQWLHGKAVSTLSSTSHFKEVERLHIKLHKLGRDILILFQAKPLNSKHLIYLMSRLDYISLEVGTEIAILNDMMMITEYHKDPLTGLLTRHLLDKIISTQIEIAKATESNCALLMIDLDNFKEINDTFGHLAGDQVIQHFATVLKTVLRKSDFIFRFGGEEFLVLVPSTKAEEAHNIAQKLCNEVSKETVVTKEGQLIHYSVSIGVTSIEPSNLSFVTKEVVNHYIGEADARLYLAKRNGRNRVE